MPIYHRDIAQYDDQYDKLKLGIPTSSNFFRIVSPTGKKSKMWLDYAHHLLAERWYQRRDHTYTSPHMERGLREEEFAVDWYAFDKGLQPGDPDFPALIGFITDDDRTMGCTPDRLVGEDGLVELKCPAAPAQFGYLLQGLADTFKPQLQGQLLISQRVWVDNVAWHDDLPKTAIRVERDDRFAKLLETELGRFVDYLENSWAAIQAKLEPGRPLEIPTSRPRPSVSEKLKADLQASLSREDKARSAGTVAAQTEVVGDRPMPGVLPHRGLGESSAPLPSDPSFKEWLLEQPIIYGEPVPESDAAAEDGAATGSRETAGEASANLASPLSESADATPQPGVGGGGSSGRKGEPPTKVWRCECGEEFEIYGAFSRHRQRTGHKAEAKAVVGSIEREARAGPCAAGASGDAAPSPLSPRHPEFRHGKIFLQGTITREDARAYPDRLFVFGDNMARKGFGGQEPRGEPNAVGIPTKWRPDMNEGAFFTNADWQRPEVQNAISEAFKRLEKHLEAGADVVYPAAGIGTGHAQLAQRAPKIAAHMETRLAALAQVASIAEHKADNTEQRPEALRAGRSSSGQDIGMQPANPETRVRVPPDSTTEETFWDIAARSSDYKVEIPDKNIATIGRDQMMNLVADAPTVEALTAFYQGNLSTIETMGKARVASRNEIVKAMTRRKKELSGE